MLSAWSNQGLIASYNPAFPGVLELIDQTVGFADPFYRQTLPLKGPNLQSIQWNSTGTMLLLASTSGSIEIFKQAAGFINQFESFFFLERFASDSVRPICSLWCENRRVFSFNPTGIDNNPNNNNNSVFTSKSFHLNFVPPGRACFLLVLSDGTLEIFTETPECDQFEPSSIPVNIFTNNNNNNNINNLDASKSFAIQRPNGRILLCLHCPVKKASFLIEFSSPTEPPSFLGQFSCSDSSRSKVFWSEPKELLILMDASNDEDNKIISFNCFHSSNFAVPVLSRSIEISHPVAAIFHSSRAPNYIFVQSSNDSGNFVSVLNLNGEFIKSLVLGIETLGFNDNNFSDTCRNPLIISPNGLVVGKLTYFNDCNFPLLFQSSIGELSSKNAVLLREFLGKLISSSLNTSNSWDIFQLIRRSTIKISNEEASGNSKSFTFISSIMAEWLSLLDSANIPARDFYGRLLDLFKFLPDEFIEAYTFTDMTVRLLAIEKTLLASNMSIKNYNPEDYSESNFGSALKWPEIDQIAFEFDINLISLVPVLEEGLQIIIGMIPSTNSSVENVFCLAPLNDECFRIIGLIWTCSHALKKLFSSKSSLIKSQTVSFFFNDLIESLSSKLDHLDSFVGNFLGSLRTDPQIQPKCTRNLFLFLIEFFLDPTNLKKVHSNVLRIHSRFSQRAAFETDFENHPQAVSSFYDSIKCLQLPLNDRSGPLLVCRKCWRISTALTTKRSSKRELLFSAAWQTSLWKSRCQCGSLRRLVKN